jgi:hypothetical protein
MLLAAGDALDPVMRRAVEPVNKVKIFFVYAVGLIASSNGMKNWK